MQRRRITLNKRTIEFLEHYGKSHQLAHLSSSVEAAVKALQRQILLEEYETFARDYAASPEMQREAELWLEGSFVLKP